MDYPLLNALKNDDVEYFENFTINNYKKLYFHGNYNQTILMNASNINSINIVKYILEKEYYSKIIDIKNNFEETAFLIACGKNNMEIINMLIDKNCDINAHDSLGWYAITTAYHWKHHDLINFLINKRAKIDTFTLGKIIKNNDEEIFKELVKNDYKFDGEILELYKDCNLIKSYIEDCEYDKIVIV